MLFKCLIATALLSQALAVDVQVVAVGKNPVNNQEGNKFYPQKITAKPGSMVQFQFWAGNHTVTQSNFDNACVPINEVNSSAVGIDSSFMPVAESTAKGKAPTYTIMINDTGPLWFYCRQSTHCEEGMSLVINEDTSANATRSIQEYQKLSQSATGSADTSGSGSGSSSSGSGSSSDSSSGSSGSSSNSSGGGNGTAGGNGTGAAGSLLVPTSTVLILGTLVLAML